MSKVVTKSGTVYEFDGNRVRRVGGAGMRRDDEWLTVNNNVVPTVGERMVLMLEPLGEGNVTFRTTTPVTEIL